MYYIKIEDNQPVGYPMTEATVREILSNISFPTVLDNAELLTLGFALFVQTPMPEAGVYQSVAEITPLFDGTTVTQQFEVTAMGEQEIQAVNSLKLEESKSRQKQLLTGSDWTELPSVRSKNTEAWATAWDEYRTSLRDMDKLEQWPFVGDWPTPPDTIPDVPDGESV